GIAHDGPAEPLAELPQCLSVLVSEDDDVLRHERHHKIITVTADRYCSLWPLKVARLWCQYKFPRGNALYELCSGWGEELPRRNLEIPRRCWRFQQIDASMTHNSAPKKGFRENKTPARLIDRGWMHFHRPAATDSGQEHLFSDTCRRG